MFYLGVTLVFLLFVGSWLVMADGFDRDNNWLVALGFVLMVAIMTLVLMR